MTGAHIFYYTSDGATYPTRQDLQLGHDNINISFDQYYDGSTWRAAHTTASYAIYKTGGNLQFRYAPANGANNSIGTPVSCLINSSGQFQIQPSTYSSSTTTGAMTISGGVGIAKNLYVGSSLYLPTSGGTPSALNYYEEYSMTTTFQGLWAINQTGTVKFVRSGSIVSMFIPYIANTGNATVASFTNNSDLPTRFRPTSPFTGSVGIVTNNTYALGRITVNVSAVNITIYRDPTQNTTWTTGQTNGVDANMITYLIT